MLIRIVGTSPDTDTLLSRDQASLEELGLLSHTTVEVYEEESINFRDMIFEGVVPEQTEITSLFISLFG